MRPPDMLLNLEDIGESSDDSDFRIEDHCLDESDSSDGSEDSNSSDGKSTRFIPFKKVSTHFVAFIFMYQDD